MFHVHAVARNEGGTSLLPRPGQVRVPEQEQGSLLIITHAEAAKPHRGSRHLCPPCRILFRLAQDQLAARLSPAAAEILQTRRKMEAAHATRTKSEKEKIQSICAGPWQREAARRSRETKKF
ncbi:hypothetical protein NDU88_006569 [Pleurodeles waltl]|uniref:Uncharacterized protein n=1 Tax=Pleurodeles waltl TaxID=8319 RepID=A0AAV7PJ73_PLEWA|nr:hypothetical protein NDU88_006569 [Pleurodeles waltl]